MSKRIRCKYFAQGACYKGESCEFSHDKQTPSRNICNFYQKGTCTYGSRCRYEHVKPSRSWHPASSSSTNAQSKLSDAVPQEVVSRARTKSGYKSVDDSSLKEPSVPCRLWHGASSSSGSFQTKVSDSISQPLSSKSALNRINLSSRTSDTSSKRPLVSENHDGVDNSNIVDANNGGHANGSVCPLAADGNCSRGENCPDVHGELCTVCGKCCLHPFKPQDREEHIKACEEKKRQLEALKLSEEIECSVCFDRVFSKPTAAERKFGILSECDHPFCITCIRNWRRSSPASGMDVNNALRACPICRKLSYFVVPSEVWYTTKEEKAEIIDNYKQRLKSIDCKHFSFGNGNCPFGTSCFYKHTVKPGSYTWVHQRPPPPRRRNHVNVDSMLDVFDFDNFLPDYLMGVDDDDFDLFYTLEDLIDPGEYGLDEDNPLEMAFLLNHLGFDPSDDDLSDDEY